MDEKLLLKETQSDYFDGLIDKKIEYSTSTSPIVIENAQFIDLKGCVSIITSNTLNISHTLFTASYIAIAVYISSTSDVFVDRTCVSSCMSSTSPSQSYGDVFCIEKSNSIEVNYCSLTSCMTTRSTTPNGYVSHIKGSIVDYKNHNTSFCYGNSMPGDHIFASELICKHCYSGHTKCGIAAIEHNGINSKHQIRKLVIESVQFVSNYAYGYYECGGKIPVAIEDCTFWNLSVSHELYSSGVSLTATGCIFSSSLPKVGSKVTLPSDSNHFGIREIVVDPIKCYQEVITKKNCKFGISLMFGFMERLSLDNILS